MHKAFSEAKAWSWSPGQRSFWPWLGRSGDGWTDRCCRPHDLLCIFFPPSCEEKTTIWRGVKPLLPFSPRMPAENVNLRLSREKKTSSSLVCGLGDASRQIYDALPPPPPNISPLSAISFSSRPSQSQLQFIQQSQTASRRSQLQRARTRALLLICMQLQAAVFHTSWLTVAIIPTEDE